jgi:hypothetical protein
MNKPILIEEPRVITINKCCALRRCPDRDFRLHDGVDDRWIDIDAKLIECLVQHVFKRDERKRGYRLVRGFRQSERSRGLTWRVKPELNEITAVFDELGNN